MNFWGIVNWHLADQRQCTPVKVSSIDFLITIVFDNYYLVITAEV